MMTDAFSSRTNSTLLLRLRKMPPDQSAWREFMDRYGRMIHAWCLHWKLQEADAADVTQSVLLKLFQVMKTFEYDPTRSFRGWLKTVAHHTLIDFVHEQTRRREFGEGEGDEPLHSQPAREDFTMRLMNLANQELFELASTRIRLRVEPRTWDAFVLTGLKHEPAQEVALRLDMPLTNIYKAKSNIIRMLQEEIRLLDGGDESSHG